MRYDIAIIGAGLSGLTLAYGLAQKGFKVIIFEKNSLQNVDYQKDDGRSSAISTGSKQILETLGVWQNLAEAAGPINEIRITDDHSPLFLHFDHKTVSRDPMGYMMPNFVYLTEILKLVQSNETITIIDSCGELDVSYGQYFAKVGEYEVMIVVAADGRGSKTRQNARIQANIKNYDQTAIVFTMRHEKSHHHVAQEIFRPSGPLAVLPLKDGHLSSIVWCEAHEVALAYKALTEVELMKHFNERLQGYLGKISLASSVFTYPLNLVQAQEYYSNRLVLIGDSAHGIHPIAGQGINLGYRDIHYLIKLLVEAKKYGQDIGSVAVLKQYEELRRDDNKAMVLATDYLNSLFVNQGFLLSKARKLGLYAVENLTPLKGFFINYAMGFVKK